MPVIDMLATMENQRSSHNGTCFEAERPEAFDTAPTSAVTKKWQPVNVVAAKKSKINDTKSLIKQNPWIKNSYNKIQKRTQKMKSLAYDKIIQCRKVKFL